MTRARLRPLVTVALLALAILGTPLAAAWVHDHAPHAAAIVGVVAILGAAVGYLALWMALAGQAADRMVAEASGAAPPHRAPLVPAAFEVHAEQSVRLGNSGRAAPVSPDERRALLLEAAAHELADGDVAASRRWLAEAQPQAARHAAHLPDPLVEVAVRTVQGVAIGGWLAFGLLWAWLS